MAMDKCTCGAPVAVTMAAFRNRRHDVVGCKACNYSGKPPAVKLSSVSGTAPSAWASYLVNGDASGISEEDIAQANAFAAWMGGPIVGCDDYGFTSRHDAIRFGALGADCQTYTALVSNVANKGSK